MPRHMWTESDQKLFAKAMRDMELASLEEAWNKTHSDFQRVSADNEKLQKRLTERSKDERRDLFKGIFFGVVISAAMWWAAFTIIKFLVG